MYIGKRFKKFLIASVIFNGLFFTPELYFHDVAIKSIPNSLSILSSMISICNNPKKPQRNPNPKALDVSGSKVSAASFNFSLFKASLKSSNLLDSMGYNPQ